MGQRDANDEQHCDAPSSPDSRLFEGYRWMLTGRLLDEKVASLYRAGKIHGGVYLGKGQEALSTAVAQALNADDIYAPLIRDMAGRLTFGESINDALRSYLGSPHGPMQGRDGNIHRGNPAVGYLPMISHLGAMLSVVSGILLAHRIQGKQGPVGATCIGDGGTSTGAFHEGLNLAAVEKLPLIVVVANNRYAYSTPTDKQFACRSLVDKAVGYGIQGHEVDGTDLAACQEVLTAAVANARSGQGPQLVIAELLRLCGHGEHDDAAYVDPNLKRSPVGRDCLEVARQQVLDSGQADITALEALRESISQAIDRAVTEVTAEGKPDAFNHDWCALSSRQLAEPPSKAVPSPSTP